MRCLIIGDGQFLDILVTKELLLAGWSVALLDVNEPVEEIVEDCTHIAASADSIMSKAEEVQAFAPDCVIHLSARTPENVDTLCELCEEHSSHFVVASSFNVYKANAIVYQTEDGNLDDRPMNEKAPLRKEALLGDAEQDRLAVEAQLGRSEVPSTVLRLPPVYGPGDKLYRLYPLISRMLDERPFIPVPESQANWKWTHGYSEDIAHGIALAALKPAAFDRVYNIGESKAPTILERITHLATVLGWKGGIASLPDKELPPHIVPKGNFNQNLVLDTSKIRSELGYREKVDYYDGLYEAIEWYRENPPPKYKGVAFNYKPEDALKALVDRALNSD